MTGLKNLFQLIYENWATITAIAAVILGIYVKISNIYATWKNKSDEEKQALQDKAIADAKLAISDFILSWVAQAEIDWKNEGSQLGPIKRADVISQIYKTYPVLTTVVDKDALIGYIDSLINDALVVVRDKFRGENN